LKQLNDYFKTTPVPDEPGPINSTQVVHSLSNYVDISLIRINAAKPGSFEYNEIIRNLRYIAKNLKTTASTVSTPTTA